MLQVMHLVERGIPGNATPIRLALACASAALLGIGALLVMQ